LARAQSFLAKLLLNFTIPMAFHLDRTEDALRPRGVIVDKVGFDVAMERQRADARRAWAGSGDTATETLWLRAPEERLGATEFLGYEAERSEGVVSALIQDGQESFAMKQGARCR
jgi:alanyl-tRNA synthetase